MSRPYPQATVIIAANGGTVYGWNEGTTEHIRVEGDCTDAVRAAVEEVHDCLERDRNGLAWGAAMLQRLSEAHATGRAFKEARQ